jgi:hypothetical protein
MPFAEPETALAAMIDPKRHPAKNLSSCGPLEALYDISTTYTKSQSLTEKTTF